MRLLLWLWLGCAAWPVFGQEIVTLQPRPGVSMSFFIANMGEHKPQAAALLFIGGGGYIRLRMEDGQPRFGAQNFLPRSRLEFVRNGILPVIMDNPTDMQGATGMSDEFRRSAAHVTDVRAALAEVRRRYPTLPLFVVGTSRSTLSAAHLGAQIPELSGVVLSASMFYIGRRAMLANYDFSAVKVPLLFVHHREDACESTPYQDASRFGEKYPLVSVKGGKTPESGPCDPLAPHGFFGKEAETVGAIAAWMLKKPYRNEID